MGAAVFSTAGTVTVTNSTLTGTTLKDYFVRRGDLHLQGSITAINSTIVQNNADVGEAL